MISIPLLIGVLFACFLVGAVPALVVAIKPRLQELLHLDSERVDRLERLNFFLAWVAGMPLAGYLADARDHKAAMDVLVAGSVGIAFTLAFFGVMETPRWIGAMTFLLGLATSFLVVGTICLAQNAIPGACPAAQLNAAFIAIGIGSFTPQFTLSRLERWFGLRRSLLILGLGALTPIVCLFVTVTAQTPPIGATHATAPQAISFLHDIRFWLLAIVLLLYYPIESALDIWSEPFLNEIGYRDRTGRGMLIGFWVCFLLARLAMWFLLGPRNEIWLLALGVLTSAVVLGNLVGAYGASSGGVGFWLVGACYGPLLPGFLGLLLEYFSASPGIAIGCVLGVAGLHDALAQPIMQRAAQGRSVRVAMRVPLLLTLLMLIPLIIIGLVQGPAQ